jgi:hypothetical protein
MRKFAIKLLVFVIVFLIFDKLFIMLTHLSAEAEVDKRLEYVINGEMNKDIIVLGSSTGCRDVIASQIEDATGLSTYNLCYPGSDVLFHEFILRSLLEFNDKPRIAILVVDDNWELTFSDAILFRKDRLYPLVKYPYIWEELAKIDDRDRLFSHFLVLNRIYKYNLNIQKKKFTSFDTLTECGSMPISWKPDDLEFEYMPEERAYVLGDELPDKLEAFRSIIDTCKKNEIALIVVSPPVFKNHSEQFEDRMRQLLNEDGIYYYVYDTENPLYKEKENYFDVHHLMKGAAIEFTDELIEYLNEFIENDLDLDKG